MEHGKEEEETTKTVENIPMNLRGWLAMASEGILEREREKERERERMEALLSDDPQQFRIDSTNRISADAFVLGNASHLTSLLLLTPILSSREHE